MSKTRLGLRLGRPSSREKLLIDRLRRGETQLDAAIRFGTTEFVYGQIERGFDLHAFDKKGVQISIKAPSVGSLVDHERCILHRRRTTMTQQALALEIGRSRSWVILMEQGVKDCADLLLYWEG